MNDLNQISKIIVGAAFEVSNRLGCGFLEKVYHNALIVELIHQGLSIESQKMLPVYYRNELVGEYFADILVENKVIVELKTVKEIESIHFAQLLNYLKASNKTLGLLINFAKPKVEIKRVIN
ncbi:GxxExxY protein [Belliella aquatica]|uniref:GxxExxY protein n=1 Tax=Belliella aquatica TaxID=1323734 RepID=A0ABQ1LMX4_9BACT|nr:GxxExxY protein [Belliella aquatica]MCH7404187.1 GxxExxY protein [Belliella aquatica]GGC26004.1 hypothetical protein GCM10010993_01370 [Belliella aquatica]